MNGDISHTDLELARRYHAEFSDTLRTRYLTNNTALDVQKFTPAMVQEGNMRFDVYNLEKFSSLELVLTFLRKPYSVDFHHDTLATQNRKTMEYCRSGKIAYISLTWKKSRLAAWRARLLSILNVLGLVFAIVFLSWFLIQWLLGKNTVTGGSAQALHLLRDMSKWLLALCVTMVRVLVLKPLVTVVYYFNISGLTNGTTTTTPPQQGPIGRTEL